MWTRQSRCPHRTLALAGEGVTVTTPTRLRPCVPRVTSGRNQCFGEKPGGVRGRGRVRGVILDEAVTDLFSAKVAFELRDAAGEGLNHEASGGAHFYVNPKLFKSKRVFFFF